MRNLRTFLTASSLLAAVLLFWAQLWERSPAQGREYVVGLGLSWTFASVLLTLFAMAWAGFASVIDRKDEGESPAPPLSIGLFGASIIMTIYNIGLSCIAIIAETASKQAISIVPLVGNETLLIPYGVSLLIVFILILIFSILFSRGRELCWGQSIASLTLLILVAGIINGAFALRDTPSSEPNWKYLCFMLGQMICGAIIATCFICYLCRKGKQISKSHPPH